LKHEDKAPLAQKPATIPDLWKGKDKVVSLPKHHSVKAYGGGIEALHIFGWMGLHIKSEEPRRCSLYLLAEHDGYAAINCN
jgi:hypothetical protein